MGSVADPFVTYIQLVTKTPDGQIYCILGWSNKIWCPYVDDTAILETFVNEQIERIQVTWQRGNEAIFLHIPHSPFH